MTIAAMQDQVILLPVVRQAGNICRDKVNVTEKGVSI